MKRNSRFKIQDSKLATLSVTLFFIFLSLVSEAAYRVYLKNGHVISNVEAIEKNNKKIKIYKRGILLELSKDDVIKIEKYEAVSVTKEPPIKEELPEYLRSQKSPYGKIEEETDKRERLKQLKTQYQQIIDKLGRIETLEKKSRELETSIYRSLRLKSPRKARMAREEKAEIDRKLQTLRVERETLLKKKKELEDQISNLER